MIAHFSISSRAPEATAHALAKIISGSVFSFPVVPGSFIAVSDDGSGLAIEVMPERMAHHPGEGDVDPTRPPMGPVPMPWEDQIRPDGPPLGTSPFHAALVTELDEARVLEIARRAGWRALGCERGGVFRVIEVWVDGTFLIEVLTRNEATRYRAFMNPAACAEMFGPPLAA